MANKTNAQLPEENISSTVTAVENFFEKNKKTIWYTIGGVVAAALLVLAYVQFVSKPKKAEAAEQMYPAEASFAAGEYSLAMEGDGNVYGFRQIIDEYGSAAGKAVYFYAGVCALREGNYEEALSFLGKYNGKDEILSARAEACKGDAYVGLEKYKDAASAFEKAAGMADNVFAAGYLLKAGVVYEKLGENGKALKAYKAIKEDYPQSIESYDIDKYIARVQE